MIIEIAITETKAKDSLHNIGIAEDLLLCNVLFALLSFIIMTIGLAVCVKDKKLMLNHNIIAFSRMWLCGLHLSCNRNLYFKLQAIAWISMIGNASPFALRS